MFNTLKTSPYRIAALLILAFALRAGYGLRIKGNVWPPDAGSFDSIAWNLASEGRYVSADQMPTSYRPPSYVGFLAGIYKIAGHNYAAARAAQAFLGAALLLVIMSLTRRITAHPSAPWIAGGMAAVYPFFIYYDSKLIADAFIVFWLMLSVRLFFYWRDAPSSFWRAAVCGLSFAFLCLIKSVFIPFFAAVLLLEAILSVQSSRLFLQKGARLFLMALIFAGPILLWGLRNQRLFGRFLLDTHGGITSVECIMFYAQCKQGVFPEFFKDHPLQRATVNMTEAESDAFYLNQTKMFIRAHPGRYLRQALGNLKNFWRLYPRQDIDYKEGRLKITVISLITEPFLIIAGLIGLIKMRRAWRTLYPMYLVILFLSGVHALTTGQMRYRLPLMPFAIIFTACALTNAKPREERS